jgi:hypothetical protein
VATHVRAKFVRDYEGDDYRLESFSSSERSWGAREAVREALDSADACGWLDIDVREIAPLLPPTIETLVVLGTLRWTSYRTGDGYYEHDVEFEVERIVRAEVFPGARMALARGLAFLSLRRRRPRQ